MELFSQDGNIFRYSPHENTFLNYIYRQLREDAADIAERDQLCEFIKSITISSSSATESREGKRNMVDLWYMVKRYYYDPYTRGSNSVYAKKKKGALDNFANNLWRKPVENQEEK